MLSPLVTAVIPCHNHEKWISEAINSIANQTYKKMRIIVVNDGSTDNSEKEILKFIKNPQQQDLQCFGVYKNIPICLATIPKEDELHGPSVARNVGIKIGWQGTNLFAFLDSDDYYEPTKVEESVNIWAEYPDIIGVVYSDFTTFNEDGLRLLQLKPSFDRLRLMRECIVNCDSLISKGAIEKVGLFDEEMRVCEDYDLWMRISEHFMLAHIAEPLVNIRVGSHSSTSTVKNEVWQMAWQRVMNKAQQRMTH